MSEKSESERRQEYEFQLQMAKSQAETHWTAYVGDFLYLAAALGFLVMVILIFIFGSK